MSFLDLLRRHPIWIESIRVYVDPMIILITYNRDEYSCPSLNNMFTIPHFVVRFALPLNPRHRRILAQRF